MGKKTLSDSTIRVLMSGTTISNIHGNGLAVTDDRRLAANSALGRTTCNLADGGSQWPS